ncbi:MAG: NapC/NirT family cytochrome c [Gammaproteobacteria bacterium]
MVKKNILSRYWHRLCSPSSVAFGIIAVFFFLAGIAYMRTFDWTMAVTNTEQFCIGCHEMKDNVYPAYTESIHYSNRSGVRAACSDCHVPHKWSDKVVRKVQASKEVWGKITGKIDTPEKFAKHRLHLAQREWQRFRGNDSLECRNCHDQAFFNFAKQDAPGVFMHQGMIDTGGFTCIDCHKGIAHDLPEIAGLEAIRPATLEPTMRAPFDHAAMTLE